jgi:hypothetical protein
MQTPVVASDFINTPLQRGDRRAASEANRFNGLSGRRKTVETVLPVETPEFTPLKRGVNENPGKTVECDIVKLPTPLRSGMRALS